MAAVLNEWRRITEPAEFDRVSRAILAVLVSAQIGAARAGAEMVPAALEEVGYPEQQRMLLRPAAFAGAASDGRDLQNLIRLAPRYAAGDRMLSALGAPADGTLAEQRMVASGRWLALVTQQQIADAGRAATSVAITATDRAGWMRYVNPPCCQRCAILAGRIYRHSHGFKRHPGCDCQMAPVSDRQPDGYLSSIDPDQIHDLTEAQRNALEDGGDLNQIVNAYRARLKGRESMLTTSEGTSRRGWATYAGHSGRRLTPDGIYQIAGDDRVAARRLLAEHGYLVGNLRALAA